MGAPLSSTECLMDTSLSAITQLTLALSPITVSCIRMESLTTAPLPILTPLKIMQFSTVPSMMQPSATKEFLVAESGPYREGISSRSLVEMGLFGLNRRRRLSFSSTRMEMS